MGGTFAEARAQFVPFQMKYGTSATPDPFAEVNPAPVTALQTARISAMS